MPVDADHDEPPFFFRVSDLVLGKSAQRHLLEWTREERHGRPPIFLLSRYFAAPAAACSISFATTSGWEMNATWLDLTSLVVAFIRLA